MKRAEKITRRLKIEDYLARRDSVINGKRPTLNFMIKGTSGIVAKLKRLEFTEVNEEGLIKKDLMFPMNYVLVQKKTKGEDGVSGDKYGFLFPIDQTIIIEERKNDFPIISGIYTSGRFPRRGEQI